jgi:hypothetical protein
MQATNILGQRTLPRYRHREKQRIKTIVVEAFPEVTSGRENQPFLLSGLPTVVSLARVFEVAAALFAVVAAVFWSLYAFGELPQMMPVDDPVFAVSGLAIMTTRPLQSI